MANKQARISDYWGKESEEEEDDDVIEVTPTAEGSKVGEKKRKGKDKENNNSKKKKKTGDKIDGLTLTQHKRMLGDQVKSKLEVAGGKHNWHIMAKCHVTTSISREAFKAVIMPHVDRVIPANIDKDTEVQA